MLRSVHKNWISLTNSLAGYEDISMRSIRSVMTSVDFGKNLMRSDCSVQCRDNEVLVTAYCGATRNPAQFLGERAASCGLVPSAENTPLVAICVGSAQ